MKAEPARGRTPHWGYGTDSLYQTSVIIACPRQLSFILYQITHSEHYTCFILQSFAWEHIPLTPNLLTYLVLIFWAVILAYLGAQPPLAFPSSSLTTLFPPCSVPGKLDYLTFPRLTMLLSIPLCIKFPLPKIFFFFSKSHALLFACLTHGSLEFHLKHLSTRKLSLPLHFPLGSTYHSALQLMVCCPSPPLNCEVSMVLSSW